MLYIMFFSRYIRFEHPSGRVRPAPSMVRGRVRRNNMTDIPKTHPRYASLMLRERLVTGFNEGYVAPQGLIAHGRGEMFYYLLGEKTTKDARAAAKAAAALLLEAERPVISVNGNVAALCPKEIVELADASGARIEVGLFHRSDQRVSRVAEVLERSGAKGVLGFLPDARIPGLESMRGLCTSEGIYSADVVLIPLEDGDRAEALARMGKRTIAIDLNPLSRTSRAATVTVVDEVTKAVPEITAHVEDLEDDTAARRRALAKYDRDENLARTMATMMRNLGGQE
ncbi:MAG: 4-phosphopantoate--beta-alanine ligase [Candidatus Thermoplasmatota archaeon]|nr:4-phosphopantoate--beta-alanine ligase [Candidatus Thermoplasmatota archaeon]